MFKPQKFEVWDDEIVFREATEKEVLDLGGKIKSLRLKRELTQSELGKRIGVTASYISQLERNLVSPSIDSFTRLGRLFLISPEFWANHPSIPGKGFSRMTEVFIAELPLFLGFHSQENAKHLDF